MTRTAAREHAQVQANAAPRRPLSLLALGSGALVAIGATALLTAAGAAVVDLVGTSGPELSRPSTLSRRIALSGVVVLVPLIGHLWGGYTAGRMARRSGVLHGLSIPVLVALAGLAALAAAGGLPDRLYAFADGTRYPLLIGVAVGAAALAGSAIGGWLGARWHRRLESTSTWAREG